jgi:hypothetical protein
MHNGGRTKTPSRLTQARKDCAALLIVAFAPMAVLEKREFQKEVTFGRTFFAKPTIDY